MSEIDNFESVPTPEFEPSSGAVSLGLLLRKAREARSLGIDDVVHALKFSARQIEAVEADRMDSLPGSVFQRGLVRSYARFLKLDPEPLLGLVESSTPVQEPDIRAPENMGNASPKGGILQIPPLVAVSVLLLIAAAVMIGWHYLGGGVPRMQTAMDNAKTALEDLKPVESARPEAPPVPMPAKVEAPAAVSQPEATTTPAAQPAQVTPIVPTAPVTPVLPSDARRLSFRFSGESWIEVKDASGLVILTGIYTSGTQSVAGRAPFEVVIGNAAAVTMRDDGRPVDLKPYTRAEVSRLTLE